MLRSAASSFLTLVVIGSLVGPAWAACPMGDLNGDCEVDFQDVRLLAWQWLFPPGSESDIVGGDGVTLADFAKVAENWGMVGEQTGSVEVVITPRAAVDLGAKWRVDGGPWQDSGQRVDEMAVGLHTIEFKSIDIWARPADTQICVDEGLIATVEPAYKHPLEINEFMASNSGNALNAPDGNAKDEHGDDDDWIEIFNSGAEAIDAAGMYLADDDGNKWRFPSGNPLTVIASGGYLLIWADNWTDSDENNGPLHTNFKLSAGGDAISLYDTDGESLIDGVDFDDQTHDISYGRDANDSWRFFPYPSPGWENDDAYLGAVADTQFSHDRGFYDEAFSVTIVTDTKSATIRYTTDGSTPSETVGQEYTGSVPINTTTCLRAMAFKTGWKPTDVDTHTYIFVDDVIEHPEMSTHITQHAVWGPQMRHALLEIPTVSLVTPHVIPDYPIQSPPEVPVSIEMVFPDGTEGFQADAVVERFGGQYTLWPKQALRVSFKSVHGPSRLEFDLFGDTPYGGRDATNSFNQIILRNGSHDSLWYAGYPHSKGTYVRNRYCFDRQIEMGHLSLRGRFVHMYLNGVYWGQYHLMERPTADHMATYLGGEEGDYDIMKGRSGIFVAQGSETAWNYMVANTHDYDVVQDYLDIDNYIDYMLLNFYGGNDHDWYPHHNWIAGRRREAGNKFMFFMWDNDFLMRRLNGNTIDNGGPGDMLDSLVQHEDFRMRLADRAQKHFFNDGMLTPARIQADFTALTNRIARTIIPECARWSQEGSGGTYTPDSLQQYVDWIKFDHGDVRTDTVIQQMRDAGLYPSIAAPAFHINGSDQHGGYISWNDSLSMSGGGTIYYTTNGKDPRLPGGAVNISDAQVFSTAINLSKSTQVKARVRSGSTWSALSEATFCIDRVKENLRITEIMYHPMDEGNPNDPNEEYIELTNIGPEEMNLNLVKFSRGIDFTFGDWVLAEGGHVLVVRDLAAFADAYPGRTSLVAGQYMGALDDGGERIELLDAGGQPIMNFRYKDGWRSLTDGSGYSLTLIDPNEAVRVEARPPLSGLVAHWKLDDGSGETAADSAGAYNGIVHGRRAWTAGQFGGALDFDGIGDYISLPVIDALKGVDLTVEAWIRLGDSSGARNPVLTQNLSNGHGYHLVVDENRVHFSLVAGRDTVRIVCPDTLSVGRWYHVAGTSDGLNMKVFIDGALEAAVALKGRSGTDHAAAIGYDHTADAYYQGQIDDVRVYNWALGEEEFQNTTRLVDRWSDKESWRASARLGGSPGWDDSGIVPNPGVVVVNEILAHSHGAEGDWIELHNTTDGPIDIGGWYLSDSAVDLTKYRFADGTKINAHGYLVLYQHTSFGNRNADPGCATEFAFSENGDQAYLSSAEGPAGASVLTGYRVVEDFGASETGVSFGRYFKGSTGNYNFVPMGDTTPSQANTYPRVGPIVINEIMYNPDWPDGGSYVNDEYEYIELHNCGAESVKLYRDDQGLPWKFTDGIDYTFPPYPGVEIAAGEYLLVVKDPDAFMWRYPGVPAGKVLGPYTGRLSNGGERVELSMPGDVDNYGTRYYIMADRVNYSDGSHPEDCPGGVDLWPTAADGSGASLTRKEPFDYGNDPDNWVPSTPSPGAVNHP